MLMYVSYKVDGIELDLLQLSSQDAVSEIRDLAHKLERAFRPFKDWVVENDGTVIIDTMLEGKVMIDSEALGSIYDLHEQFQNAVGTTLSIGVGLTLNEAEKALLYTEMQGGGSISFYDIGMEEKFQEPGEEMDPSFLEGTSDGSEDDAKLDAFEQGDGMHSEDTAPDMESEPGLSDDEMDEAHASENDSSFQTLAQINESLKKIQAKAHELESLKVTDPHLYAAALELVKVLVMMAHQIKQGLDENEAMQQQAQQQPQEGDSQGQDNGGESGPPQQGGARPK